LAVTSFESPETANRLGSERATPALPARQSDSQQPPVSVYGVFKTYNWQAEAGYTFFRFYLVPHRIVSMNGLNLGITYYPGGKWIGAEGEFLGTFGTLGSQGAKFASGMGGARFRWAAPRGLEVWGHALAGGAHFLPQTAFGGQSAFAYEAGVGVDVGGHERRFAYRAQLDMIGTHFFGTYQYSPRASIGIVFKY
jgi:hypothetical protein